MQMNYPLHILTSAITRTVYEAVVSKSSGLPTLIAPVRKSTVKVPSTCSKERWSMHEEQEHTYHGNVGTNTKEGPLN